MADTTTTKRTNYQGVKEDYTKLADELYNSYKQQGAEAAQQAYALRRQQQQQAEQDFYNQLYDTNATVLDTIRRNNASAIATGASKGAAAANELSTILQGQQTSVDAATELAQSNYDLASEEANAYITAEQQARQQAATDATTLAGNLAVAGQADAQIEAANISAEAAKYQTDSDYNKLKNALGVYTNPDSSEANRLTAAAIIKSLTGDTVTNWIDTYGDTSKVVVAPDELLKSDQSKQNYLTSNDIWRGGSAEITGKQFGLDNSKYNVAVSSLKKNRILYSDDISTSLKTAISNAPNGYIFKVGNDYYILDRSGPKDSTGSRQPQLLKITNTEDQNLKTLFGSNAAKIPTYSSK